MLYNDGKIVIEIILPLRKYGIHSKPLYSNCLNDICLAFSSKIRHLNITPVRGHFVPKVEIGRPLGDFQRYALSHHVTKSIVQCE